MLANISDRKRIELSILARLLYGVASQTSFSCFNAGRVVDRQGFAELMAVRSGLEAAAVAPFSDDQHARRRQARKVDALYEDLTASLVGHPAAKVTLTFLYLVKDVIDEGILILIDGSDFAAAADKLIAWSSYATELPALDASARKQARKLREKLAAHGYFGGHDG